MYVFQLLVPNPGVEFGCTFRSTPQYGLSGKARATLRNEASDGVYLYSRVFIFGWIQKRTKKITAAMTRADVGSGPKGHPPRPLRENHRNSLAPQEHSVICVPSASLVQTPMILAASRPPPSGCPTHRGRGHSFEIWRVSGRRRPTLESGTGKNRRQHLHPYLHPYIPPHRTEFAEFV
jgi:hypothetical protein